MNSMTGFGRASFSVGGKAYSVEITSVNQKGLALGFYAPGEWNAASVERLLAPLFKKHLSRGKVNVYIKSEAAEKKSADFEIDPATVKAVFDKMLAVGNACSEADLRRDPQALLYAIDYCARHGNAQSPLIVGDGEEAAALLAGTTAALEAFVAMRRTEGEHLKKDLRERIGNLKKIAAEIEAVSAGTVGHYREKLLARLQTLGIENIDPADERVIREVTIFADRCDISEERTRLASHLQQFEATMEEGDCGRKLDFICQEMLRELNTMGSKANNLEITRLVVEGKNEQERLREQVQNVE
ncbi:MAG: YicC family protein [Opitutales bacterium]|nr:YicC family protein [Opitutales bacterium]